MNSYQGCCDGKQIFNFSKIGIPGTVVRWDDAEFSIVLALNVFIPFVAVAVIWWENSNHTLARILGNPRRAVVLFAVILIFLTLQTNFRFGSMLRSQPHWYVLQNNHVLWSGYALLFGGSTLLYRAFRAAGFYASFYGFQFGVNVPEYVEEFPYNFLHHPAYVASVVNHVGLSLVFASQAGLIISLMTAISYAMVARIQNELEEEDHLKKKK